MTAFPYYLIVWKDAPGQQVSTVVDAVNEPLRRSLEYIEENHIKLLEEPDDVLKALDAADGVKFALPAHVARATLGWDV